MGISEKNEYLVKGVEEVLVAFDDFEHYNPIDQISIEAGSLDEAITIGRRILQEKIDDKRRRGGFMASGTFTAYVTEISEPNGAVVYKRDPPARS